VILSVVVDHAQAPSTAGVVVMCTWLSATARSAGAYPRYTMTGVATPTTVPGSGEMPVVTLSTGVTVVKVPVIGTALPSVPVAVPVTV
jgi:hypothetical protein